MCSTPEGIGAGITAAIDRALGGEVGRCSTPEGIGAGITSLVRAATEIVLLVLNARRHRSGNYLQDAFDTVLAAYECSTPEGIGAGITRDGERSAVGRAPVLNARRHRSGNYPGGPPHIIFREQECSTPEGIGAGITAARAENAQSRRGEVLNARRHRSGNYAACGTRSVAVNSCAQRPKASERELRSAARGAPHRPRAQRPKASERELHGGSSRVRPASCFVLNARRHRSGNYTCSAPTSLSSSPCSTSEGIGAGITRRIRISRTAITCAQRPKASERELPRTEAEAPSRLLRVLNARRHRSGNYLVGGVLGSGERRVLNARRHRSGNYPFERRMNMLTRVCSTPEGIGAGITRS